MKDKKAECLQCGSTSGCVRNYYRNGKLYYRTVKYCYDCGWGINDNCPHEGKEATEILSCVKCNNKYQ